MSIVFPHFIRKEIINPYTVVPYLRKDDNEKKKTADFSILPLIHILVTPLVSMTVSG